jgi:hypothetical protein
VDPKKPATIGFVIDAGRWRARSFQRNQGELCRLNNLVSFTGVAESNTLRVQPEVT